MKGFFVFYNFSHFMSFRRRRNPTRSSTKIGFSLRSYLRGFLLRRNDK